MKIFLLPAIYAACYFLALPVTVSSQSNVDNATPVYQSSGSGNGLFETDKVLEITLRGNIRALLNDRGVKPAYHPLLFVYKEESGDISIPVAVKTRGHFRKLPGNCYYPPLLVQFIKTDSLKYTLFKKQDKLKMVMPCNEDQYVILEWLAYKIYNLVTPKSFRTRLVQVKLDEGKKKKAIPFNYAILLETEKQMAKRNKAVLITRKIQPEQTDSIAFLTMAVFEYLIGNTDWCVQYFHNIKLVANDLSGVPTAVPYDFDHSGLVNASYAKPADELLMRSVLERRFRGYCLRDLKQFEQVIALYNRLKKDIYEIFTGCALLDARNKQNSLKFLDEFYETINHPKIWHKDFSYPCNKNGTGNVVIRGMREE